MNKPLLLNRRNFLQTGGMAVALTCAMPSLAAGSGAEAKIARLEKRYGGHIGFFARDLAGARRIAHRADEHFALCSTFKWLLAAAVLHKVDQGIITLDHVIPFGKGDLLDYAPFAQAHLAEGSASVEAFCQAAVELSDNTAANLLLDLIGGPPKLTSFLRENGDGVTRLDRTEPSLNSNLAGDQRDSTTPAAMTASLQTLLLGGPLSDASRAKLLGWMKNCQTGLDRVRAGLPSGWIAADKTGTGVNGAVNDCGIVWPPNGGPILFAVYLSGSSRKNKELVALHGELGRVLAGFFG